VAAGGNDETCYFSKRARAPARWDHFRYTVQAAEHAAYILIAVIHRVGWLVGLVGWLVGRSVGRSTSAAFMAMLMGNGKDHSPLEESPRNKTTFESRILSRRLPGSLIICKSLRRHFVPPAIYRFQRLIPPHLFILCRSLFVRIASACAKANTEIVYYIAIYIRLIIR